MSIKKLLSAQGYCHRARPLLAPAREARRPAACAAAGAHDEQIVRVLEHRSPGRLVVRARLTGQAAGALPVRDAAPRTVDDELLDVALAPPARSKNFAVLAG